MKAFLLAAVLLLVVQHLISSAQGPSSPSRPLPVNAREMSDADLQGMIWRANEDPTYDAYLRISRCYEKRGEYRKALQFLRRAEKFGREEATE